VRGVLLWALWLFGGGAGAQAAAPDALRARFADLSLHAVRTVADRPVYLQSSEAPGRLQGDVYALVERPYADVRQGLSRADQWCAVLILHLNVKYCRASGVAEGAVLNVGLGRKVDEPLVDVSWVKFAYRVASADETYLDLVLQAPTGPLGTQDYRIAFEAVPYTAQQALVHLSYAYGYGTAARWSMQAYLATVGSDKRGFSIVGRRADGQPTFVTGLRGVLERNVMRYHLAVEAHVMALALPAPQRLPQSLQGWFSATELYALQLHEVERADYIAMKQREVHRQATESPPARAD
jgi:hypothetical protein